MSESADLIREGYLVYLETRTRSLNLYSREGIGVSNESFDQSI